MNCRVTMVRVKQLRATLDRSTALEVIRYAA